MKQISLFLINIRINVIQIWTTTKKAPFEAFSDQQVAVSCSSSIKFQVAYSAFSSSHALRLAESEVGFQLKWKWDSWFSIVWFAEVFEAVFMIQKFKFKNYMQVNSLIIRGRQGGTGIPDWKQRGRICRENPFMSETYARGSELT